MGKIRGKLFSLVYSVTFSINLFHSQFIIGGYSGVCNIPSLESMGSQFDVNDLCFKCIRVINTIYSTS